MGWAWGRSWQPALGSEELGLPLTTPPVCPAFLMTVSLLSCLVRVPSLWWRVLQEAALGPRPALPTFRHVGGWREPRICQACREHLYHSCQLHHNSLVSPYIFLNVTEYSAVIN